MGIMFFAGWVLLAAAQYAWHKRQTKRLDAEVLVLRVQNESLRQQLEGTFQFGPESDTEPSDFATCAVCESLLWVQPNTAGPLLCCMCRADVRADAEEADDLPIPNEAEIDALLARVNRLEDEVASPVS